MWPAHSSAPFASVAGLTRTPDSKRECFGICPIGSWPTPPVSSLSKADELVQDITEGLSRLKVSENVKEIPKETYIAERYEDRRSKPLPIAIATPIAPPPAPPPRIEPSSAARTPSAALCEAKNTGPPKALPPSSVLGATPTVTHKLEPMHVSENKKPAVATKLRIEEAKLACTPVQATEKLFDGLWRGDTEVLRRKCLAIYQLLNPERDYNGKSGSYLTESALKLQLMTLFHLDEPSLLIRSEVAVQLFNGKRGYTDLFVGRIGQGGLLFELKYIPLSRWLGPHELRVEQKVAYLQALRPIQLANEKVFPYYHSPEETHSVKDYVCRTEKQQTCRYRDGGLLLAEAKDFPFVCFTGAFLAGNSLWKVLTA